MRRFIIFGLAATLLVGAGAGVMWIIDRENAQPEITVTWIDIPGGGSQRGVVGSHCWPKGFFSHICADGELRYPSPRRARPGSFVITVEDSEPSEISVQRLPEPDEPLKMQILDHRVLEANRASTRIGFELPACSDNFLQFSASWGSRGVSDRRAVWGFLVRTTGC